MNNNSGNLGPSLDLDVERLPQVMRETARELEETQSRPGNASGAGDSWKRASDLVHNFEPVPPLLWTVLKSTFATDAAPRDAQAMAFSAVVPLLRTALTDSTLGRGLSSDQLRNVHGLTKTVDTIGSDVSAAICFIHAVCRRIANSVNERIWKPLLDDALLRAQMGYHVGRLSPSFGSGRGMLAGFASRSGLAVQIAAGTVDQIQQSLERLAGGSAIREVGTEIYGCEPLQVSAMMLIAGGCGRNAAFGVSKFGATKADCENEEQLLWLSAFSVVELMRIGGTDAISGKYWRTLGYSEEGKSALKKVVQSMQRRGHTWAWITQPVLVAGAS